MCSVEELINNEDPGWPVDIATLDGNHVFNFFPFLFTAEGKDINTISRKPISVDEQYQLNFSK
jgi:hypothetical protein